MAEDIALVDVVAMAIASDERISAARAALGATQEMRVEARSYRLPKLNAIGEISTRRAGELNAGGIQQRDGERLSGGIEVTHDLYTFGRNRARGKRSQAQISIAELELQRTTQDVALEVIQTFYNVLQARRVEQVHDRNARDLGAILEATQAQFEKDLVTSADLALVSSRERQAEALKTTANANYRVQLETLRALADMPGLSPDTADMEIYRPALPASLQDAVEQSLIYSPAIQIAESQEHSSRADLDMRRADLFPKLVARGSWVQGQVGDISSDEREVGLSVNMPLFDGGLKRSWTRRAEHDVNRARALLEGVKRQKRDEIQISWTEFQTAQTVAASWAAALKAEQEALAGINENVKENLLSIIYLLEARDEMVKVEVAAIESQIQVHENAFGLLHKIGNILKAFET